MITSACDQDSERVAGETARELVALCLADGYSCRFRAEGTSMYPAIRSGELVTAVPLADDRLRRGQVVVARDRGTGRLLIHRVIKRSDMKTRGIMLRGDNSHEPDGWFRREDVLGVVRSTERNGKSVGMKTNPFPGVLRKALRFVRRRMPGICSLVLVLSVSHVVSGQPGDDSHKVADDPAMDSTNATQEVSAEAGAGDTAATGSEATDTAGNKQEIADTAENDKAEDGGDTEKKKRKPLVVMKQAEIRGRVFFLSAEDQINAEASGLCVELRDIDDKDLLYETATDEDGRYVLPNLDIGRYELNIGLLKLELDVQDPGDDDREKSLVAKNIVVFIPRALEKKAR